MDTHVLLWWFEDSEKLSTEYRDLLLHCEQNDDPLGLSIISLWEISKLSSLGKIRTSFSLDRWFNELENDPLIHIFPLSGAIILESLRLGTSFPKDPADQLIVAAARFHHLRLLTADERIRDSRTVIVA